MSLYELYSGIILEHYKKPHNVGEIEGADISSKGYNESCGDDIRVFLKLEGEIVKKVAFVGKGCAISQSSASMMTDRMEGMTLSEALDFIEEFSKMITGEKEFPDTEDFEELAGLKGVIKFPIRVKCASLAWNTLKNGIMNYKARKNGSVT